MCGLGCALAISKIFILPLVLCVFVKFALPIYIMVIRFNYTAYICAGSGRDHLDDPNYALLESRGSFLMIYSIFWMICYGCCALVLCLYGGLIAAMFIGERASNRDQFERV